MHLVCNHFLLHIMADRNRRKSSILKIPKTRAPLQDVNSLDVKSSSDDEITSYTALRRRVSFAGKNFVKEFCSEAEIASVFHAPEYEQLLVTSDSSNNTHSDIVSDNNSTIQNRTQASAYRSLSIQDDYDPCEQILREFKGNNSTQPSTGQSKPAQKTRFSFGEIRVPTDEPENETPPVSSVESKKAPVQCLKFPDQKSQVSKENNKLSQVNPEEQNRLPALSPRAQYFTSSNMCGDAGFNVVTPVMTSTMEVCSADATQFLDESMDFTRALPGIIQTNTFAPNLNGSKPIELCRESLQIDSCQQGSAEPSSMELGRAFSTEIQEKLSSQDEKMVESAAPHSEKFIIGSTMGLTTSLPSDVRENPVGYYVDQDIIVSESVPCHSKTQLLCTSMEFTTALPTNIQTCLLQDDKFDVSIQNEEENFRSSNKTVAMSTTMELTTALPSNIRESLIDNHSEEDPRENEDIMECENVPSHSTSERMCTSMEFTTALPSNIQTHIQGNDKIVVNIGKEKDIHQSFNKTVPMSTTMEFTTAMPSNIKDLRLPEDDIQHHSDMGVIEREQCAHSKTQMMCTSMEFTTALPTNIQTPLEEDDRHDEVNHKCQNKTNALSSTMEFTTVMSSNIRENVMHHYSEDTKEYPAGHHSHENTIESDKVASHSKTQILATSMEFTMALPNNIQTPPEEKYGDDEECHKCPNKTNVLSTTMEFTAAMPSCITQNFVEVGNIDKTKFGNEKGNSIPSSNSNVSTTSMEQVCSRREYTSTQVASALCAEIQPQLIPSKIGFQCNENVEPCLNIVQGDKAIPLLSDSTSVSMKSQSSVTNNFAGNLENSRHLSSRGPDVCHIETEAMDTSGVCLKENVQESKSRTDNQAIHLMTEFMVTQPNQEESSRVYLHTPVVQQENSASKQKMSFNEITISHHLNDNSAELPKQAEESLAADQIRKPSALLSGSGGGLNYIPDPFQSRPQLLPSPSKQGGIESLLVQTSQSQAVLTVGAQTAQPADIRRFVTKSSSLNMADHKQNKLTMDDQEQGKQDLFQSDSAKLTVGVSKESPPFDPFKSRPCLKSTPIKENAHIGQTISNSQPSTVESCINSGVKVLDSVLPKNRKSLVDGPLLDILARDCDMFHDGSFSELLEISETAVDNSVVMVHSHLERADAVKDLAPQIQSEFTEIRVPESFSDQIDIDRTVPVKSSTTISECVKEENKHLDGDCEVVTPLDTNDCRLSRSSGSTLESEGHSSEKSILIQSSKRSRDPSQETDEICLNKSLDRQLSKRMRDSSWESQVAGPSKSTLTPDLQSRLSESLNRDSCSSDVNCSDASLSTHVGLSINDIIYKNQIKHPQCWDARKSDDTDLWTFKFKCTCLELKVHLKPSRLVDGNIEANSGCFVFNDSGKPVGQWGMKILKDTLSTKKWTSLLHHSTNFMDTLQQIVREVWPVRKFIIETIIQEKTENLKISNNGLYFDVVSFKCHLWFQVHLTLDFWENYTPDHISVNNVIGNTRELEVKNLITGVEKDVHFLRNYIRDVKDYVKTLEEFCK
ncbi:hypothetical protein FOCC_FOCC016457 [Frankliniella occidentalis]|nr:hypothetical protein FOCC_FOCC016457 [Frankliniella occidentalis]